MFDKNYDYKVAALETALKNSRNEKGLTLYAIAQIFLKSFDKSEINGLIIMIKNLQKYV